MSFIGRARAPHPTCPKQHYAARGGPIDDLSCTCKLDLSLLTNGYVNIMCKIHGRRVIW